MMAYSFRDARAADLPRIVEIYNASIPARLATGDLEPVSIESRKAWFAAQGVNSVTELDWWQLSGVGALKITCVPVQHWSQRTLADRKGLTGAVGDVS